MKHEVRLQVGKKVDSISSFTVVSLSEFISKNLNQVSSFVLAQNIGIYVAKNNEVGTINLIQYLLDTGKKVFIPRVKQKSLEFKQITAQTDLVAGTFGILEPMESCPTINPGQLDILIVPCIAIDYQGNRIGHGKGFYDRFIASNRSIKTICLAYEIQVIPAIQPEVHDQKIDFIVTEKRVITPSQDSLGLPFYGKYLAEFLHKQYKKKIEQENIKATLAVILVGDDPASKLFVIKKAEQCESAGIKFRLIKFSENSSLQEIIKTIDKLNQKKTITGIVVQLPLPKHLNREKIINKIVSNKDVDGLTSINRKAIIQGENALACCTPKGILRLLDEYHISLHDKKIVLVGFGYLVGQPLFVMLRQRNILPSICTKKTKNLIEETQSADILITAAGAAHLITDAHLKKGALVIDAGAAQVNDKILGDVDFEAARKKASLITPVPHGIGPMTIAMLIENVLNAYELQKKSNHSS